MPIFIIFFVDMLLVLTCVLFSLYLTTMSHNVLPVCLALYCYTESVECIIMDYPCSLYVCTRLHLCTYGSQMEACHRGTTVEPVKDGR